MATALDGVDEPAPSYLRVRPIEGIDPRYVFRLQLGPAILDQLEKHLAELDPMPLGHAVAQMEGNHPGFYQLFLGGVEVYIGRSERPLRARLGEHKRNLQGRRGIDPGQIEVKYIFVEDPSLVSISEGQLIPHFSRLGKAPWNASGFGSKAPGYGRSGQERSAWDLQYPADLDVDVTAGWPPDSRGADAPARTLLQLVASIAKGSPVTFSVPKRYRPELAAAHPLPRAWPVATRTLAEWLALVEQELAEGWHIQRTETGV